MKTTKATDLATSEDELSEFTLAWLAETPISHRKSLGQYMTPRLLRDRLLDQCKLFPGMRVLDPGVGTGEFLRSIAEREPEAELYGWDVDAALLEVARKNIPSARLYERSALDHYEGEPFDLVIGNPPFFQFRASDSIKKRFADVISGRVNIFALFVQSGLEALTPNGQLAYVIPPSMNNGAYFNRLREYILENSSIEFLEIFYDQKLFDKAQTPVQLLVLNRGSMDTGRHTFVCKNSEFRRTIFSKNTSELEALYNGKNILFDLGYEAVTGTIVWNNHREELRREANNGEVPLIWAHNIQDRLHLQPEHKRPQYIQTEKPKLRGPAIVSNRIVGAVGSGDLRCALVPEKMKFVAENHVNVIRQHNNFQPRISWRELLARLRAPDISEKIRMLTGNTQVSATELTHLLPI